MDPRHNGPSGRGNGQLTDAERRDEKAWTFLGAEIVPNKETDKNTKLTAIVPPTEENEGSTLITTGSGAGFFGQTMDVRGDTFANEQELIVKYRFAAQHPEVDAAIQDIVNESIVGNDSDLPVKLNLNNVDDELASKAIKEKLTDEFEVILRMLDFRRYGHDIFRRWYVDGRLAYHVMVDLNNVKKGIQELRPLSPMKIRKIKEVVEDQDPRTGAKIITSVDEYFIYNEEGFASSGLTGSGNSGNADLKGLRLTKDAVAYVTSGWTDATSRIPISYIHKALRNVNQLRMMEDSLVIYRLARAPERRIFYIDVGNLPKAKAESYLEDIKNKYRNKMVYDVSTGDVKDGRRDQSILEDFWLPRREGGKGTEISTLPGGDNLGQIDDIIYFQKKLYKSLNVPVNRLDNEAGFAIGRSTEISRDEVKFQKFIDKLRVRFADLFKQLLRTQLIFKGIVTSEEWDLLKEYIIIDYARDSHFAELAEAEMLRERVATLQSIQEYVGEYFSKDYVRKVVLGQTDDDILEMKKQMRKEALNNDELPQPEDVDTEGGAPGAEGGGGFEGAGPDFDELGGEGGEAPIGGPAGAAADLGPDEDEDDLEDEE